MAKEYIERDVAIKKTETFCDVFVTQWTDEKVLAWIKNLPTADVVEVVRCRDCVKRKTQDCSMYYESDDEQYSWEADDDFCSQGKRRDSDD